MVYSAPEAKRNVSNERKSTVASAMDIHLGPALYNPFRFIIAEAIESKRL
jgi:hypothetical protein